MLGLVGAVPPFIGRAMRGWLMTSKPLPIFAWRATLARGERSGPIEDAITGTAQQPVHIGTRQRTQYGYRGIGAISQQRRAQSGWQLGGHLANLGSRHLAGRLLTADPPTIYPVDPTTGRLRENHQCRKAPPHRQGCAVTVRQV